MTTNKNVTKSFILKVVINPIRLFSPVYITPNATNKDITYNIITIIYANIFDNILFILNHSF